MPRRDQLIERISELDADAGKRARTCFADRTRSIGFAQSSYAWT